MGRGHRTRSQPGPGVLPPPPLSPSPCSPFPQMCVLGPKEQMYSLPVWGARVQNQGAGRTPHPEASRDSLQASPPDAADGCRACCPSACSRPPEEVPSSGSDRVSRVSCKDTREFRTAGSGDLTAMLHCGQIPHKDTLEAPCGHEFGKPQFCPFHPEALRRKPPSLLPEGLLKGQASTFSAGGQPPACPDPTACPGCEQDDPRRRCGHRPAGRPALWGHGC